MQHAQSRLRSLRWTGRGALASLAGLVAFGVSPALPALAGTWSAPVQLPGSCGSSVAVNQAGAMAAGGTFTAADGTTHVQVCTSPDGKTWQATDLGPGGTEPHGGQHPVVALSPDGHAVAVWGSAVGCPAACDYIVQAAVRPPGGSWGAPVTLTTDLYFGGGGIVLGMDGAGNAIAAWVGSYADASHYAVLPAGGSWGAAQELSNGNVQGAAHGLGLAVSPDGSVVVAFANKGDAIWAASGTVLGGLSAPVFVATGDYSTDSAPKAALDDAGNASLVWSQTSAPRRPPGPRAGPGARRRYSPASPPAQWPPASTAPGTPSPCSGRPTPGTWPAAAGGRPRHCRPARPAGWSSPIPPAPSSTPTAAATRSPSQLAPPASAPAADRAAAWAT